GKAIAQSVPGGGVVARVGPADAHDPQHRRAGGEGGKPCDIARTETHLTRAPGLLQAVVVTNDHDGRRVGTRHLWTVALLRFNKCAHRRPRMSLAEWISRVVVAPPHESADGVGPERREPIDLDRAVARDERALAREDRLDLLDLRPCDRERDREEIAMD